MKTFKSRPRTSFDKLAKLTSTDTGVRLVGKMLVIDPKSNTRVLTDHEGKLLMVDTEAGRVGRLSITLRGLKLKEHLGANDNGYRVSWAKIDGKRATIFHHQLICWLVHGPAVGEAKIPNHMDLNRANNSRDNLEWVDNGQNTKHGYIANRLLALGYSNALGYLKHPLSIRQIEEYNNPLNTDRDFHAFAKWLGW